VFLKFNQTASKPRCYIRQLDIQGVDSKFIEQHKGILNELLSQILPDTHYYAAVTGLSQHGFERRYGLSYEQGLIRFRLLDRQLAIQGLMDLSLPVNDFKQLQIAVKTVFIVENKINLLAFPNYENALVIFGSGYAVNRLADVDCLQQASLYYWGDLDVDGMAILSQLRQLCPKLQSIMMDMPTLAHCAQLTGVDIRSGAAKNLSYLSGSEQQVYRYLQEHHLRLEQERINFSYVQQYLDRLKQLKA